MPETNPLAPDPVYQVPVPAQDLGAVYELLAQRARYRNEGIAPMPTIIASADLPERELNKTLSWDDHYLSKLIDSDAISIRILVEIMDVIAKDPAHLGGRYGRKQLMEHMSAPEGSFTVAFTKWTSHFKKQYDGIDTWPIVGESTNEGHTVYWMTDEILERWKKLREIQG